MVNPTDRPHPTEPTAAGPTTDRTHDRTVDVTDDRTRVDPVDRDRHLVTEREHVVAAPVDRARGGVSFWSILSGVLVAFGAFVVIAAIVGAILGAIGVTEGGFNTGALRDATIGAGVGVVIAQFLAYLWGGYTAGRMARGSGAVNGLLVALMALIIVAILGAIVVATAGNVDVEAQAAQAEARLPLPLSDLADIGTGIGIGVLVAMFLGGALGGALGARWHTKLENAETAVREDAAVRR